MTSLATITRPVRVLVDDDEIASGDLEIEATTHAGELARRVGVALVDGLRRLADELADHFGEEQMNAPGRPTPLELAEVAYSEYGDFVDWTNHAGNEMPRWAELPERQRTAWAMAAGAVWRAILTPPAAGERRAPASAYEASHPDGPGPAPEMPAAGSNTGGRA